MKNYIKLPGLVECVNHAPKLFDSLIAPILVYSCEIWGFENKQGIEKIHTQYGNLKEDFVQLVDK
jgi:hypothetical protein